MQEDSKFTVSLGYLVQNEQKLSSMEIWGQLTGHFLNACPTELGSLTTLSPTRPLNSILGK